ncbi:MAG: hypothetical protein IJB01_00905 [Bacteroidaceae bacterium]|nr:hypothetical protein [Bacteroidaceae bacterium]
MKDESGKLIEIFRFAQNDSLAVFGVLERSEPTVDARGVSRGVKVKDLFPLALFKGL